MNGDIHSESVAEEQRMARVQREAIAPLVKKAAATFFAHQDHALPELSDCQVAEKTARELALELSQMILVLDYELRQVIAV